MKSLLLLGIPMALTACASAPDLLSGEILAPAADAQSQIRHLHGQNVLPGYTARPVKGPENWRKLNDQQSPAGQGES